MRTTGANGTTLPDHEICIRRVGFSRYAISRRECMNALILFPNNAIWTDPEPETRLNLPNIKMKHNPNTNPHKETIKHK